MTHPTGTAEGWAGMMICPGCGVVLPFIWTTVARWDSDKMVVVARNMPDPFWFTGADAHHSDCPEISDVHEPKSWRTFSGRMKSWNGPR